MTELDLADNGLTDLGVEQIAAGLERNDSVRSLNLGFNRIGDEGAAKLSMALRSDAGRVLSWLVLSGNGVSDSGARALAEALGNSDIVLATLLLSHNEIADRGVESLAAALERNRFVTTLGLCGNKFTDRAVARLSDALEKNSTLTSLDLASNSVAEQGAKRLLSALEKNHTLVVLNLDKNRIFVEEETKINHLLKCNKVARNHGAILAMERELYPPGRA